MGDEKERQVELSPQVGQQVEDLRLDRHVQRRNRLIADDELGVESEGARDADALSLAARELVRVASRVVASEPDRLQIVLDSFVSNRTVAPPILAVGLCQKAFADDVADRHPGIERAVRILEDDLHSAAHLLERIALKREDIRAVEVDLTRGCLLEAEHRSTQRRLAAAGLPHQTKRLAAVDLQADIVHGVDGADLMTEDAAHDREVLLDVLDVE